MIKQFLRDHPLISPNGIEKALNIPTGTIRLNSDRPIPERYISIISDLLGKYGLNHSSQVIQQPIEPSQMASNNMVECIIRNDHIGTITNGAIKLFNRVKLLDNTIVYVKESDIIK
jgi:hypothetical protein